MVGFEVGVGCVLLCVNAQQMILEIGRASSRLICWSQGGASGVQSKGSRAGRILMKLLFLRNDQVSLPTGYELQSDLHLKSGSCIHLAVFLQPSNLIDLCEPQFSHSKIKIILNGVVERL